VKKENGSEGYSKRKMFICTREFLRVPTNDKPVAFWSGTHAAVFLRYDS
jgi:predicted protein tyrosine phosphatase